MTPQQKRQADTNALLETLQVFWAFSDKQFVEGKAKLNMPAGDRLISIGAGGFMPAKNKQLYLDGMKAIYREFTEAMKDQKARTAHILYQLNNHEAYYTRDISTTLDALGDDFTREEVQNVFNRSRRDTVNKPVTA